MEESRRNLDSDLTPQDVATLADVDSLAGSLGTGRPSVSIENMKQGAKAAMAQAGRKGLRTDR